jgi:DNA invertase Pin-like site-specific DNA recombinase
VLNRETSRADGHYKLKTAEGILKIQLADIREERKVEVVATVVYTPKELYEAKLKEKAPETAADEFQIAEYARLIGALPEAKLHYEKLLAFEDSKYPEAAIKRLIQRIEKLMNSEEAVGRLQSIERHIVYNRFEKAKVELEEFGTKYAEERDLILEAERLGERLEKQRKEYFIDKVAKELRNAIKDVLNKKVREPEISIREAQNFAAAEVGAEQSASRMAVEAIAAKLKISPDEVMDLWKERTRRVVHKAFYRDGTFIILEDMEDALSKAPKPKVPKGKQAPKLPKPRPIMTAERWWESKRKSRKWTHMRDFLYAFWAEKSGAVELIPEKFDPCPTCVGKGYVIQSVMTQQGNAIYADRCSTCYMAKGFRIVRFK